MKRIILFIDSADSTVAKVALEIEGKRFEKIAHSTHLKAQMVLPLVEKLLLTHHLSISDISEITLSTGPGSFTGLRVSAAIANTLGFLLAIPVNGQQRPVIPSY